MSGTVDRTADSVNALLAIAEIHERDGEGLKDSVEGLKDSQAETTDRLNVLINTVERYIEKRDGYLSAMRDTQARAVEIFEALHKEQEEAEEKELVAELFANPA